MPRRLPLLLALGAVLAGLAVAAAPSRAADPPGVRAVSPLATDARLVSPLWDDHVVRPQAPAVGRLLVFLPGTGAGPLGYDEVLVAAARAGYHAIGLTYDNGLTVGLRCGDHLECYGRQHQQAFDGVQGVEHRLAALLALLARRYPGEGWGSYLSGGLPVWSRVVVGGHSQGAAAAAWTARVRVVAGVLLFSGPVDADSHGRPATWLGAGHRTPASRYVALTHAADPWFGSDLAAWRALGLPGASDPARVDRGLVTTRHALVTSAPVGGRLAAHNLPVVDPSTPRCASGPALAPVWRAMLALTRTSRVTVRPAC